MNIPNMLSVFRIVLIPFTGYFVYTERLITGVILFALACGTDILDGYIARKYDMITDLGKILDPIADKGMQLTVLICMAIKSYFLWPAVMLIFLKELIMAGGTASLYKKHVIVAANWYGKLSTVVTSVCVVTILLFFEKLPAPLLLILQWLPAITSLFALIKYGSLFASIRKEEEEA